VRTSTAGSGRSTLALHTSDPTDMIVTDLRMPDGDGVELVYAIRVSDNELPIIVVTGQVLRKPLDLNELAAAFNANLKAG
jgi:two-component system cell cycle sensor histidine kinase/response regulator CckA